MGTSLMRALHSRTDARPLIQDPWGDRLIPEAVRAEYSDAALAGSPAFANVITRTRYAEDALHAAISKGMRQYVLIGAGFDSFALRRPDFAKDLEIFEIDHPATQQLKLRRIEECGQSLPPSVHFISVNLAEHSVAAALSSSSYRSDQQSFFSWLGVTMYLTREANLATFKSIASCSAPGSEVVFTYLDQRVFASSSGTFRLFRDRVAALGEPLLSGFEPHNLAAELAACGLTLSEDLTGEQVTARYGRQDLDTPGRTGHSHMALAQVSRTTEA